MFVYLFRTSNAQNFNLSYFNVVVWANQFVMSFLLLSSLSRPFEPEFLTLILFRLSFRYFLFEFSVSDHCYNNYIMLNVHSQKNKTKKVFHCIIVILMSVSHSFIVFIKSE